MKHELKREYTGQNESRTITPTCSCGWRGTGYAAWNDYQHTMVKEQESEHMRKALRKPDAECNQADLCAGCRCDYAHGA